MHVPAPDQVAVAGLLQRAKHLHRVLELETESDKDLIGRVERAPSLDRPSTQIAKFQRLHSPQS